MTAIEAMKDVLEEIIAVTPDDAQELIDELAVRGFVIVPKPTETDQQ